MNDSLNMRHDDPRIDFMAPFFLLGWMKNRVKGTFREFIYTLCTDISTNLSHILYQPLKKKKIYTPYRKIQNEISIDRKNGVYVFLIQFVDNHVTLCNFTVSIKTIGHLLIIHRQRSLPIAF